METCLTDDDERQFFVQLYFGTVNDELMTAMRKAYGDFKRTLRGFQQYADRSSSKAAANQALYDAITALLSASVAGQDEFDLWHEGTCDELINKFGGFHLHYGQAQKWINMSLKYLFVLDRPRVAPYWQYCHVPLDDKVLKRVKQYRPPPLGTSAWSKIDSYEQYLLFQNWFREQFPGIPMDNEWRLWLNQTE